MKTQPLSAEVHRTWGWRPFMTAHTLTMPGCTYSLDEWPDKTLPAHTWWAVYGFVDDFGDVWVKTSH